MSKPGKQTRAQAQRSRRIAINKNAARMLPGPVSQTLSEAARIAGATAGTVTLASALTATPAHALPQNGTVVGGSVSMAQTGSTLNINQGTNSAIINWQGYNIGAGETVQYLQPGSSSVILNRVTGADPSAIFGNISANGQVWVINPNGLVVGEGARVETAGFLGSTLNISNEDFSAGNFRFTGASSSLSSIINRGNITAADGGYVVLAAPSVTNSGVISATLGKVLLASGEQLTLGFQGNDLIDLVITEEAASGALGVKNTGTITADGGTVVMSAKVAADLLQGVVNNEGIIRATSIVEKDGAIILDGGERGMVANSGTLDASGRDTGEKGGEIKVLGDQVALSSTAVLDASGDAGGGTILTGGNFHGAGTERNSSATNVARGAELKADAITDGDGGKVAVWSDGTTEFHGNISARGGAAGGNGGRAEVSGREHLAISGFADLLAVNGENGVLEVDPGSVSIIHGGAGPTAAMDTITDGWINTQLASSDLQITTDASSNGLAQRIDLSEDVGITWSSGNTLTLSAGGEIYLRGSISAPNGFLHLNFDQSGAGATLWFRAAVDVGTVSILGSGSTSLLIGPSEEDTIFTVSGPDKGKMGRYDFDKVGRLAGWSGDNTFIIEKAGSLSGGVYGVNGYDTLDLSAKDNVIFNLETNSATDIPFVDDIQVVIGNGANSTFIGRYADYTYNVTDVNSAKIELDQLVKLEIKGFGNLTASKANDIFIFHDGGSLSGAVDAGQGHDTLNYASRTGDVEINLQTSSATGMGQPFSGFESVVGNGARSTIVGADAGENFTVSGADAGTVGTLGFTGVGNLTGGSGADSFVLQSGGTLSGVLAGGGTAGDGVQDSLDLSPQASVTLDRRNGSVIGVIAGLSGIERIVGNGSDSRIIGRDSGETFTVTGNGSGTVDSGPLDVLDFTGFTEFTGGSGADTFIFQSGGSLTGRVDGGGASGDQVLDILDLRAKSSITLDRNHSTVADIIGSFDGIEFAIGNESDSTIIGHNSGETFTVTGRNAGTAGSGSDAMEFTGFNNLTGGSGADSFIIQDGASLAGSVVGGGSAGDGVADSLDLHALNSDIVFDQGTRKATGIEGSYDGIEAVVGNGIRSTIVGAESGQAFEVTGADTGKAGELNFRDVGNLTGGSGADTFSIHDAAGLSGGLVGGGTVGDGVKDTLDLSAASSATLNRENGTVNGIGFSGIERAVGNGSNSEIIGRNSGERFRVTALNSGTVDSGPADVLEFAGFTRLTGGFGADSFIFENAGSLTGSVAGGGSVGDEVDDLLDLSAKTGRISFNQGTGEATGVGRFSEIESVVGNGGDSTIIGSDLNQTFKVTGVDTGTAGYLKFSQVGNLTGGSGEDFFIIRDGGSLSGKVDGGLGVDTLNYAQRTGEVIVDQQSSQATGLVEYGGIEWVVGNGNGTTIMGADGGEVFTLTAANSGTAGALNFREVGNLAGGSGDDTFVLKAQGTLSGNLAGGDGEDTLDLSAKPEVTIRQQDHAATGIAGRYSGIERAVGNGSNSTIIGHDRGEIFIVTGVDSGTADANAPDAEGGEPKPDRLEFSGFGNLKGGKLDDYFYIKANGRLTGNLDGGLEADHLYLSQKTGPIILNLERNTVTGVDKTFTGIESFAGNGVNSTIIGHNFGNTFKITGADSGTVVSQSSGTLDFQAFGNLTGGTGNDSFFGWSGSSLSGSIADNGGRATLAGTLTTGSTQTYAGTAALASGTTLRGSRVTLNGLAGNGYDLTIDGAAAFNGPDVVGIKNLHITRTSDVNVARISGSGSQRYDGLVTLGADATLGGSDVTVNAVAGGSHDLTLISSGAGGITINGAVGTAGGVELLAFAGAITETGTGAISAASLSTASAGGQTLEGANSVASFDASNSGTAPITFNNSSENLTVAGISNGAGSIDVANSGSISVTGGINTAGDVELTAGNGGISASGEIKTAENVALTAGSGDISLAGNIDGRNIDVTAKGGSISAGGEMSSSGQVALEAADGVTLPGRITGAGNVALTAGDDISLAGVIDTVANVQLTSRGGTITEGGAGSVNAALLTTNSKGGQNLSGANSVQRFNATNDGGDVFFNNTSPTFEIAGINQLGSGEIEINNSGKITVAGSVKGKDDILLETANSGIELRGNIETDKDVKLLADGVITESGGAVRAAALTTESKGGQSLNELNNVTSFSATNAGGDISFTNGPELNLGKITQEGGDITATSSGSVRITDEVTITKTAAQPTTVAITSVTGDIQGAGGSLTADNLNLTGRVIGAEHGAPITIEASSVTTNTTQEIDGVSAAFIGSASQFTVHDAAPSVVLLNGVVVGGQLSRNFKGAVQFGGLNAAMAVNAQEMQEMLMLANFQEFFAQAPNVHSLDAEETTFTPVQQIIPGFLSDGRPCQLIDSKIK